MTESIVLKSCVGRLIFDDSLTIASIFSSSSKVAELLIEFESTDGGTRCYSMQTNYKRKYIIKSTNNFDTNIREWHIINTSQIAYKKPIYNTNTKQYYQNFKMPTNISTCTGAKLTTSIYNCEFDDIKGNCCLKMCLTTQKYMFCVWWNSNILSPEDVTDICGQIIQYSDIT
jgi:hypothetical protein